MTADREVITFIKHFQTPETIKVFTQGCCYWFAKILHERFENSRIVYNPVSGHFACHYDGLIYDITGCLGGPTENWFLWSVYQKVEPLDSERVRRYCILKQE